MSDYLIDGSGISIANVGIVNRKIRVTAVSITLSENYINVCSVILIHVSCNIRMFYHNIHITV